MGTLYNLEAIPSSFLAEIPQLQVESEDSSRIKDKLTACGAVEGNGSMQALSIEGRLFLYPQKHDVMAKVVK